MRIVNLSSGSKGNATYVETSKNKILLDAGRNVDYLNESLESIGVSLDDIDYCIITHTHTDHISSLKALAKKGKIIIVASLKMFKEMKDIKNYEHILVYDDEINLDGIIINAIHSSHDAVDSRNFIIDDCGKKVAYITDTGYINSKYFPMLFNLDAYLLESNHDIEMLQHGPYPAWLKKRVLSDVGHLSNNSAGFYLTKLIGPNTKQVLLIHLSETNNMEKLALNTVKGILEEYNILFNKISCAHQNALSEEVLI